jgi:hypothetical protein
MSDCQKFSVKETQAFEPQSIKTITLQVTGLASEEEAVKFLTGIVKDEFRGLITRPNTITVNADSSAYSMSVDVCCSGNYWTWCYSGDWWCWDGGPGCPA